MTLEEEKIKELRKNPTTGSTKVNSGKRDLPTSRTSRDDDSFVRMFRTYCVIQFSSDKEDTCYAVNRTHGTNFVLAISTLHQSLRIVQKNNAIYLQY